MRVGFWSQREDGPYWPEVLEKPWDGQEAFLEQLGRVEASLSPLQFRGTSHCRICHCANGSREYRTNKAEWPEGFRHYVEKHNLKPPARFIEYIASLDLQS